MQQGSIKRPPAVFGAGRAGCLSASLPQILLEV
jgi:hypothetical protein